MARALFLFALASMALFSLAIGQNADSNEPKTEMEDAAELEVGQTVSASMSPVQELSLTERYTAAELELTAEPSDPGTEFLSYYPYKALPEGRPYNIVPMLIDGEYTSHDARNMRYAQDGDGIIIQADNSGQRHYFNGQFNDPFEIKHGDAQWYVTIAYENMKPEHVGMLWVMLADEKGNAVTVPLVPGQGEPVPASLGLPLQASAQKWVTQVPLKMPTAGEGSYKIRTILFEDVPESVLLEDGTQFRVVMELTQWPAGEQQRGKLLELEVQPAPVASAPEPGGEAPQKSPGLSIVEVGAVLLGLRAAISRVPGNVTQRLSGYYCRLRSSR